MIYDVIADGSFTFGLPPIHGQILLDGSSLLLDGTLKGTDTSDYLDRGIAMKRVTDGSPPTYTNASLNGDYLFNFTHREFNNLMYDLALALKDVLRKK